jgi:oxalate decarboxylase/phosphoglucose isomerase-like protein (cupin superfamily)
MGRSNITGGRNRACRHFHQDAWNALVRGTKRWFLLPPGEAQLSTEHPAAWLRRHRRRPHPGVRECVQRAGDILYVPDSWAHTVVNEGEGETVAVAVEFYPERTVGGLATGLAAHNEL